MGLLPGDRFGEADAGLYQGTLVAQGAFSLYRTRALRQAGGWPDAIGEDIVLTCQLMRQGARVHYEPSAVAFTLVWLPGLVLAATGRYWIVGLYTLAVLPLTLVVNAILYRFQRHRVFNLIGLRVRRNTLARPVASYSGGGGVSA